jgi:tetratricopeptide (TPR) repeat protein
MRVSATSIEFAVADADSNNGGKRHYRIPLTSVGSASVQCDSVVCTISDVTGELLRNSTGDSNLYFHDNSKKPGQRRTTCSSPCHKIALDFAAALNSLHASAVNSQAASVDFHQQAAAWRALNPKPPIPEEVREQRLLAKDAVKNNKPGEALDFYEAGLELYATWPQGRFNAALIAAELGLHADAVEHMQAYLELVPDAPDAQSARDQIVIWRHKAKGSQ